MRELDGIRILGPSDGTHRPGRNSTLRELIPAADTGDRWSFGEVTAEPDESVATHIHPGEPEAIIILEGEIELHGADGDRTAGSGRRRLHPTRHGARPSHADRRPMARHLADPRSGPRTTYSG